MPFTVAMTGTTELNDSVKLAFESQFIIANAQLNIIDNFVQYRRDIGAASIKMTKYGKLALATTPLTEDEDVASAAMSDSEILLTPAEYGTAVTTTNLIDLQSGGQSALASMQVVAINMMETKNKLGTLALEASANVLYSDGLANDNAIGAGDVMTTALLNTVYNKLSRTNVPKIGNEYIAILHDDVINDLRAGAAAGSWMDVNKYAQPGTVLANEVGMLSGFRIVRNNHATFGDQGGAGTVDVYDSMFLGMNGLGLAESMVPQIVTTGPYDKLDRFVNIGWKGTFQYKIVDTDAVYKMVSAAGVGNNA